MGGGVYKNTVVPVIVQFRVLYDLGSRHTGSPEARDWGAISPPEPVPNVATGGRLQYSSRFPSARL